MARVVEDVEKGKHTFWVRIQITIAQNGDSMEVPQKPKARMTM